jgi:hypothetical protein
MQSRQVVRHDWRGARSRHITASPAVAAASGGEGATGGIPRALHPLAKAERGGLGELAAAAGGGGVRAHAAVAGLAGAHCPGTVPPAQRSARYRLAPNIWVMFI